MFSFKHTTHCECYCIKNFTVKIIQLLVLFKTIRVVYWVVAQVQKCSDENLAMEALLVLFINHGMYVWYGLQYLWQEVSGKARSINVLHMRTNINIRLH
jgi:hypothetical protein